MAQPVDWLSRTVEEALEPHLPIIDAHHHWWIPPERTRYLSRDLVKDAKGHNIRQTVFIECEAMYRPNGPERLRAVGETEFVERHSRVSGNLGTGGMRTAAGIVGAADLRDRDVLEVLEAHKEASPTRFRGIRHRLAAAPGIVSPVNRLLHVMSDQKFRRGFSYLDRCGLSFDAWVYHPQIAELTELAIAFPETTIVLNHLGGPLGIGPFADRRREVFASWKRDLTQLAACPNVVVKLGGVNMPISGYGWHERGKPPTSDELVEELRDWYLFAIEKFGPRRCMFESNFPVDRESCSYTVLWNQFKKLTRSFSAADRAAMFHDTAVRVYRLEPF